MNPTHGRRHACRLLLRSIEILLFLYLPPLQLLSQIPEFPDSLANQGVVARTERFEGTHATSLFGDYRFRDGIVEGNLRSYLLSSTTLLGTTTTKDQIDLRGDLEYLLPTSLRLFMIAEGTLSNDVRRDLAIPGINNTASTFLGIGGRVYDKHNNHLGVAVGGSYNRQLNVEDAGVAFYGEAIARFELEGYKGEVEGKGRLYNIAPRHNSNGYLALQVTRSFDEGGSIAGEARYEVINTDIYIKRSEEDIALYGGLTYDGVQGRDESRLRLNSTLNYPVSDELAVDLTFSANNLLIGQEELSQGLPLLPRDPEPFHYDRNELGIGISASAQWTPPRFRSLLRLEYYTNEQYNRVDATGDVSELELQRKRSSNAQSDFVAQQLLLAGSGEYRLSRRDTVSLNASVAIFRYDTPSLTNFFDRDEQSIQAQIRYSRSFSPMLEFAIYGQAFLTHLVYLSGQNSNDNNWNRIFRLSPSATYRLGDDFQNVLEAEVLANYTEYDFEGRSQNIRGRSFREMRIRDSLGIAITRTLRLVAGGELRISERGSFSWDQFAESPLERTRTEGLEGEVQTAIIEGTTFGAGGRLSRVKNYRADPRSGLLQPFSDRTSFGPTVRLTAHLSGRSEILLSGWWEHRFEESRLITRIPWLFMTVGWRL